MGVPETFGPIEWIISAKRRRYPAHLVHERMQTLQTPNTLVPPIRTQSVHGISFADLPLHLQ